MRRVQRLIIALVGLGLIAACLSAQESTGEVIGKVTLAEDGSPLPGVTVTLTGTLGTMSFVSTKEGNFRFTKVSPGEYNLRFELQGFKTVERTNIRVTAAKALPITVTMEPGTLQE